MCSTNMPVVSETPRGRWMNKPEGIELFRVRVAEVISALLRPCFCHVANMSTVANGEAVSSQCRADEVVNLEVVKDDE